MKLEQVVIDLALKYYDGGMGLQEAVNAAIAKTGIKNEQNRR